MPGRAGPAPGRGADRPRLHRRRARLPGRGPGVRRRRRADQGRPPAQPPGAGGRPGRRRRAGAAAGRGGRQPDRAARLPAHPARRRADRRGRAALPVRPARARGARRGRLASAARRRGPGRADAASCRPTEPRRHEILRALEPCSTPSTCTTSPAPPPRRAPSCAEVLARPAHASAHRRLGHRARPHRLGLAVAGARDRPQVRPHVLQRASRSMDERPRLVFACSSAQQYAWVKEHYPRALRAASRTRWPRAGSCPVGGMWVESDTNMPGGEAMARQFIARQAVLPRGVRRGARRRSGCRTPSATPRPCRRSPRRAGSRWFLTQKMSWNQTNRMPHHTFWWEGIDGTRVFTHFPPVDTYNSRLQRPASWPTPNGNFAEKGRGRPVAGAVRLRRRRRRPDPRDDRRARTARRDPGGLAAGRDRAAARRSSPRPRRSTPNAPVWSGEMYLELHRGTYTTQARTKQGNRRSEHLLREAELWAATAAVRAGAGVPVRRAGPALEDGAAAPVPRHPARLARSPGCTARPRQTYARVAARSWRAIIDRCAGTRSTGPGDAALVVQRRARTARDRASPAAGAVGVVPAPPAAGAARRSLTEPATAGRAGQRPAPGGRRRATGCCVVGARPAPPAARCSPRAARQPAAAAPRPSQPSGTPGTSTRHYRRTVDRPATAAESVELVESEPAARGRAGSRRTSARLDRSRSGSRCAPERAPDRHRHRGRLARAREACSSSPSRSTCTPTGPPRRSSSATSTGRPTPTPRWDAARFEICAHRWVHVGEPGYGVAVANDSTYGHDVSRATRDDGGTDAPPSGCPCCARRSTPTRRPTRARTASATRWCPARRSATRSREGYRSTCRCGTAARAPAPSRRW